MTTTDAFGPENREAEEYVLGAILMSDRAMGEVAEITRPHHFTGSRAVVYAAMLDLFNTGTTISVATVADKLERDSKLEQAGGRSYLHELLTITPAASNADHHAKIVRDVATARALVKAGYEIQRLGNERPGDIENLVDRAQQAVYEISQQTMGPDLVRVREPLLEAFTQMTAMADNTSGTIGTPTGLKALDKLTSGLRPGNLIIIAARPGMGKSALAIGIAAHAAHNQGIPCAVYSLEMSGVEVSQRLLSRIAKVNLQAVTRGKMSPDEWSRVSRAAQTIGECPLYVDDTAAPTAAEMRARSRRLQSREPNLGLIVVDYLQLLVRGRHEHVVQEVTQISRDLKLLARDLNVPVIAVSQLSRAVESRQDKRPILSDLRQSGSIEQDADIVMFVYRDHYYRPDEADPDAAELAVEKHRNGPREKIDLRWHADTATFKDAA